MRATSLPALGIALLLALPASSQTTTKFRITGVVVNESSGTPVPHCQLTPSRVGNERVIVAGRQSQNAVGGTETDDQGRFTIMLPSAGKWRLVASAPGYTTQAFDEHEGYFSAIVLTEHVPAYDLTFRLPPEASLSGTVLDEAGEAVRNAQVRLFTVPPVTPDGKPGAMGTRSFATTDDRGYYEFANLPPGSYRVAVTARPWYATLAQPRRVNASAADSGNSLDPSLDVTYAETWFPGVDDPMQAETLTLHAGDTAQAEFHLVPVPAIHIRVITPPTDTATQGRGNPYYPTVERVGPGSGMGVVPAPITNSQGQIDVGGLAPGLYRIRLQSGNQEPRVALVQVTESGARTVDFNETSDEATITIHFDGAADDENGLQVSFIDIDSGQPVAQLNSRFGGGPGRGRQQQDQTRERVMQVPPGRYEVELRGRPDLYLTGMSAKSAEVTGRVIKVHGGNASLTLHVARGRASVNGVVSSEGVPLVGAMVLLVPAGLDDPSSVTEVARDQTNTDGGFDLPEIIPGQYILLAINNGWQINWKDPSTLNRYLIHGVPLDLRPGAEVKQNVEAQAP